MATRPAATRQAQPDRAADSSYVVPVIHTRLPEPLVNVGFYGGLAAAVVVGALDFPLALLAGLGVAVARHRRA
ncbi:MAG: hypothetical protein M0Z69_09955 [Actinomycetota bacterium]|nr:hypothetical protein [Actinomycetota bacterium]